MSINKVQVLFYPYRKKTLSVLLGLMVTSCGVIPSLPHKEIDDRQKQLLAQELPSNKTRYVMCGGEKELKFADSPTIGKFLQFGPLIVSNSEESATFNIEEAAVFDVSKDVSFKILDKKSKNESSVKLVSNPGKTIHISINAVSHHNSPNTIFVPLPAVSSVPVPQSVYQDVQTQIYTLFDMTANSCKSHTVVHYSPYL